MVKKLPNKITFFFIYNPLWGFSRQVTKEIDIIIKKLYLYITTLLWKVGGKAYYAPHPLSKLGGKAPSAPLVPTSLHLRDANVVQSHRHGWTSLPSHSNGER